jgi:hypothetical protein
MRMLSDYLDHVKANGVFVIDKTGTSLYFGLYEMSSSLYFILTFVNDSGEEVWTERSVQERPSKPYYKKQVRYAGEGRLDSHWVQDTGSSRSRRNMEKEPVAEGKACQKYQKFLEDAKGYWNEEIRELSLYGGESFW